MNSELIVVFLDRFTFGQGFVPETFVVAGGPTGRFIVRNGLVSPRTSEGIQIRPAGLASFIAQIKAA